jgi:hypothetical protein
MPGLTKPEYIKLADIVSEEVENLIGIIEHPFYDPLVEAHVALAVAKGLRTGDVHAQAYVGAIKVLGSETLRTMTAMATTAASGETVFEYEPRRLQKVAQKALNRFNHCRGEALDMFETFATEWSGTPEDLVEMTAGILGKKSR